MRRIQFHQITVHQRQSAPGLSVIVAILMTPPRSTREWAVGLINTVVTGIGGGAIAVQHFRLQEWVDSITRLVALGGFIFGCGLPGWAIVCWAFKRQREESRYGNPEFDTFRVPSA
ncbi:hypothetical protein [Accumulibacter sp.]|uniref:hypothetical protein n=1 Tax=Accumulibacter sp. TaxID=2053492 RepID=UPI0026302C3E|nr:hypothetical protein [Accumulibacter sp.]